MNSLAGRKKQEKKVELSEEEKFILTLQTEVAAFMTIHKAAYFNHPKQIEKQLDSKVAADAYDIDTGNTPLILAARNGCLKAVQTLVEKGKSNVNLAGYGGLTALHHACKNDHIDVIQYLLDHAKAHVNVEDDAGNTPASLCARMGNLKSLEIVANKGANIDHPNKRGCTAFMISVLNCRMAVIDWFLKKPININHVDKEGNSALHYASKCGYIRVVKQLLAANIKTAGINALDEKAEDVALTDSIRAAIKSCVEGGPQSPKNAV